MPRKPADQVNPALDSREAVWAAIRAHKGENGFTVRQIREETRLGKDTVNDYIRGLEKAGYLEIVGPPCFGWSANSFSLVKDVGVEAPRVRSDGTHVAMGLGREQMWHTMRLLGTFSVRDLAVKASTEEHPVAESDAKSYVGYLDKAGYLRKKGKTKPQLYIFVPSRFSGPKPPQVQRVKQVWDANLGKVVWTAREGGK